MPAALRLFVALAPSASTRKSLAEETRRVTRAEPRARRVAPENLHLTLAFLGATPEEAVPAIEEALRAVARAARPLRVRVEGLGAFPARDRPRVIWAGVVPASPLDGEAPVEGEGPASLEALADAVTRALVNAGSPPDRADRFHPHVTLARLDAPRRGGGLRASQELEKLLTRGALQSTYSPEDLSDLLLMVSEAGPTGVRYRPLATVPLGPIPPPPEPSPHDPQES